MEVTGHFKQREDVFRWINTHFQKLPDEARLVNAGEDEGKISEKWILTDKERFAKFAEENPLGFYLFNENVSAEIKFPSNNAFPSVSYDVEDYRADILVRNATKIIHSFAEADSFLAWACLYSEYHFKNNVTIKLNIGSVESWVGRDMLRYLPGIYWCTWISDRYALQLNLSLDEISSALGIHPARMAEGTLIKLGDNPDNWQEFSEKISKLASAHDNIFYVDKVDMSKVQNYSELQLATRKWK